MSTSSSATFGGISGSVPVTSSVNPRSFDIRGTFQQGKSTTYGPNNVYTPFSEAGYQANSVGVACSTGPHDPNWAKILAAGTYNTSGMAGVEKGTIWPITATVAVSEYAWRGSKKDICWKTVTVRSRVNRSMSLDAIIVDFCPASGCLWDRFERAWNVDIYGVKAFQELGGNPQGGSLDVEISWPVGLSPDTSSTIGLETSDIVSMLIAPIIWLFFL